MGLRNLLVIIIVSLLTLVAAIAGGPTIAATPGTDFPFNIACEALLQQRSAYDESPNGCGGYDEASTLSAGEKGTRPAGVGAACGDLVEFVAAEGTIATSEGVINMTEHLASMDSFAPDEAMVGKRLECKITRICLTP